MEKSVFLDHIELHIEDKDKVGILGVNGTGKSTLIKNNCGNRRLSR